MRRMGVKNGSSCDVLVLVRVEQEPIKRHRGGDGACAYLGCWLCVALIRFEAGAYSAGTPACAQCVGSEYSSFHSLNLNMMCENNNRH